MIALALALLQLQAAGPVRVEGQVVRVGAADTVAAAGAKVTLHRVGSASQGAIDSAVTGVDGRFRFQARADSGDVLLASARWQGVEYFAAPLVPGEAAVVQVADTASTTPILVAARHVVIGGPAADGSRDVVDLIVVRNAGVLTRVAEDTAHGSWQMLVPPLIANLRIGDSDFAEDAFDLHGDTLQLFAPIPPGDRQFFLQYQLAPGARTLELPLDAATDTITVLGEEASLRVTPGFAAQGTEELGGRSFTRWAASGAGLAAVRVAFPGRGELPGWVLPAMIVAVASALGWAWWRAVAPRRA